MLRAKFRKRPSRPGVVWRGPVDQETLALELQEADLWFYPTSFCETYCITAVEMQAYNEIRLLLPIRLQRSAKRLAIAA